MGQHQATAIRLTAWLLWGLFCGLAAVHWTLFVPKKPGGEEFLEWIGGHFDYESGSGPNMLMALREHVRLAPRA